jgi:hypothetical protein
MTPSRRSLVGTEIAWDTIANEFARACTAAAVRAASRRVHYKSLPCVLAAPATEVWTAGHGLHIPDLEN